MLVFTHCAHARTSARDESDGFALPNLTTELELYLSLLVTCTVPHSCSLSGRIQDMVVVGIATI